MSKQYSVDTVKRFTNYCVLSLLPQTTQDEIHFLPGQYATLSLWRGGAWSPVRCLSFSNSPEVNGRLEFAFRVNGQFTKDLSQLQPGDPVRLQGPFGEFTLPQNAQNIVMIAGGIGITPFMSMLREAAAQQQPFTATLLYANSSQDDIVYYEELTRLISQLPDLQVHLFLSDLPLNNNQFIQGPINEQHLHTLVSNQAHLFEYYICGPDAMMKAITGQLRRQGADSDYIFTESFAASSKSSDAGLNLSSTKLSYVAGLAMFALLLGAIAVKDIGHKLALAQPLSSTKTTTSQTQSNITSTNSAAPTATDDSGASSQTTPSTDTVNTDTTNSYRYRQPTTTVS